MDDDADLAEFDGDDSDPLTVARETCEQLRERTASGRADASVYRELREWEARRDQLERAAKAERVADWYPEGMTLDEIEQQLLEQLDAVRELRDLETKEAA